MELAATSEGKKVYFTNYWKLHVRPGRPDFSRSTYIYGDISEPSLVRHKQQRIQDIEVKSKYYNLQRDKRNEHKIEILGSHVL